MIYNTKEDVDQRIFEFIKSDLKSDKNNGFKLIYDHYGAPILRFLKNKDRSMSETDLSDIMQESIIVFWINVREKKVELQPGKLKSYLISIANNLLFLKYRKTKKDRIGKETLTKVETNFFVEPFVDLVEEAREKKHHSLRNCFSSLKELDKEILMKYYYEGQTGKEISAEYQMKENWLNQRLFIIRKQLKKCMTEKLTTD